MCYHGDARGRGYYIPAKPVLICWSGHTVYLLTEGQLSLISSPKK